MPKRFECTDAPGSWVEFTDAWTRRDLREAMTATGDEHAALLRRKVVACSLASVDDTPITHPDDLTAIVLDECMDYTVYCWLVTRLQTWVGEVQRLGEATQRRLWQEFVGEPLPTTTETTN